MKFTNQIRFWLALCTALLALCSPAAFSAVAKDAGSETFIDVGNSGTTFTGSVITSGSDNFLQVDISAFFGGSHSGTSAASGCTYNGVALTLQTTVYWPTAGGQIFIGDVWYLKAPAIGTHSLVCTVNPSAGGSWDGGNATTLAFSGTSSTNPIGTVQENDSASATSISISSLAGSGGANDLYVSFGTLGAFNAITGSGNMTNAVNGVGGTGGGYSMDTIAGSQTGSAATYTQGSTATYFIIMTNAICASGSTGCGAPASNSSSMFMSM